MTPCKSSFAAVLLLLTLSACGNADTPQVTAVNAVEPQPDCVPAAVPSPYSFTRETLARQVAAGWMDRNQADDQHWDWGPAVLMYGMLDLYQATGDKTYRAYVEKWLDHHAAIFPMVWSDTVAPSSLAARVANWSCEEAYLNVVDKTYAYLEAAPKTEAGGIGHLGLLNENSPQLWVDSLFMFGSFLIARAQLFGVEKDLETYAEQVKIFSNELQAPSGFFRHALVNEAPWPESPVFWGRGNAWIASILARYLEVLPKEHRAWPRVAKIEERLLNAVLREQDPSGLWWTVIDRPGESYLETSASALFAEALFRAGKLGIIDETLATAAAEKAIAAVTARITDPEGEAIVTGTSTATQPGGAAYYASIPQDDDVHYGVGAVILALTTIP